MKRILFILFMLSSIVYSQNYNLDINLKNGNTVTIPIDSLQRLEFEKGTAIDVEKLQQVIQSFRLLQNYPNPFNPSTTIEYEIPRTAKVNVSIFSISGQLVKEVINETQTEGVHQITWDGTNQNNMRVTSGIYICIVKNGDIMQSKKMILMK